jgi:hypothetical protein
MRNAPHESRDNQKEPAIKRAIEQRIENKVVQQAPDKEKAD